jgi:uncharacterized cupredoxin-like copper-binding protein
MAQFPGFALHLSVVARIDKSKMNIARCGLLIALAGTCAAAAAEPVRVDVAMVDYRFSPDRLTLEHGIQYRLHLENRGKEIHEFAAPTFFAAKLDNPQVLNREHTEVVVQPGESKDVFVTPVCHARSPPGL